MDGERHLCTPIDPSKLLTFFSLPLSLFTLQLNHSKSYYKLFLLAKKRVSSAPPGGLSTHLRKLQQHSNGPAKFHSKAINFSEYRTELASMCHCCRLTQVQSRSLFSSVAFALAAARFAQRATETRRAQAPATISNTQTQSQGSSSSARVTRLESTSPSIQVAGSV